MHSWCFINVLLIICLFLRKENQSKIEELLTKIGKLEKINDEIKSEYCQLAAEKETIEHHYQKLEQKLKRLGTLNQEPF